MTELIRKIASSTILIVDDQKFLCSVLADLMRGFGAYDSHQAKNGAHAIKMMETIKPDLIFTDLNMEPVNGFELTQWVRRSPNSPNSEVPIIMLTGNSGLDTIYTSRDCGVTELLIKPVIPKQVLAKLHATLIEPREFISQKTYVGPDRRRRDEPNYRGPYRRACDPMQIQAKTKATVEAANGIRTLVFSLVKTVAKLQSTDKESLNRLLSSITMLKKLAIESDNAQVAKAILSLETYVHAMGASGKISRSILRDHLECIAALSDLDAISESAGNAMILALRASVSTSLSTTQTA